MDSRKESRDKILPYLIEATLCGFKETCQEHGITPSVLSHWGKHENVVKKNNANIGTDKMGS